MTQHEKLYAFHSNRTKEAYKYDFQVLQSIFLNYYLIFLSKVPQLIYVRNSNV
jgi:hypothetical protein